MKKKTKAKQKVTKRRGVSRDVKNVSIQSAAVIPGEVILGEGDIVAFNGRQTVELIVANTGDRPIQVGSHCHFFESNRSLEQLQLIRVRFFGAGAEPLVRREPQLLFENCDTQVTLVDHRFECADIVR